MVAERRQSDSESRYTLEDLQRVKGLAEEFSDWMKGPRHENNPEYAAKMTRLYVAMRQTYGTIFRNEIVLLRDELQRLGIEIKMPSNEEKRPNEQRGGYFRKDQGGYHSERRFERSYRAPAESRTPEGYQPKISAQKVGFSDQIKQGKKKGSR